MLFLGIDRVLLTVEDADETAGFFADLLEIDMEQTLVDTVNNVKVVHTGRFGLEIGSPVDSSVSTPISDGDKEFLKNHGPGIRMVVIRVSDLDKAMAHFEQKGLKPIAMNNIPNGREAFYERKDTFGMTICLNEYKEMHPMGVHGRKMLDQR